MRKLIFVLCMMLCGIFLSHQPAEAVSIIKLGRGGVVIQPNGSYKMCPQFALRKCCKIELSWEDIWNWITDNSTWHNDINTQLPINGNAVVYDDEGVEAGTYEVKITWLEPGSNTDLGGDEIIVGHADIEIEVVQ